MSHILRAAAPATAIAVVTCQCLLVPCLVSAQGLSELKQLTLEQLSALPVVSVSKRPEPYGQAPAAIQVITGDDIRRSGATSIPEALRLADNLNVAQKSAHDWAITARGFNTDLANKLLVMIDGRTVYTPLFSGVFWDRQDYLLEDIDRIEVVSGPGGTLWGANAVNGVINIITRQAGDSQGLYVEGAAGSQPQGLGGLRYGWSFGGDAFVRVYAHYADRDPELLGNGGDAHDAWHKGQTGFRFDGRPSSRQTLTIQGDAYSGREEAGSGGIARVKGGNVLGRWAYAWSDTNDLTIQAYYDRTHLANPVPALMNGGLTLAPAGTLRDDLDTYDFDLQHRFAARRQQLTWGLGYRFTHDVVENAPGLAFVPPTLDQQLLSAFVQDEVALARQVTLTLGTKVEHNDYTGAEWEPSARLQWRATPTHTVWGAVSRAIRAPARVDRDERLPTPALAPLISNLLVGGPDFRSEEVIAYEAGARTQWRPALSTSVAGFYNRYDDLRSTSLSPPDLFGLRFPLFFENNLEGHTYGLEVSADQQVAEWWRVHAGYALIREDVHVEPGTSDFNNALNETADPEHQVKLRSSMTVASRIELDAAFRWVDEFRFNVSGQPGVVAGYAELSGRVGWHPVEGLEVSLVGQNLLHDQHLEYVISPPAPRTEIGRSVYVKAAFRW